MVDRRPSRRAVLGGLGAAAATAVTVGKVPTALASSFGTNASPPAATGSSDAVETRVAPPVGSAEPGVLGETGLEAFDLVGLSSAGLSASSSAQVRVLTTDGWGAWTTLHANHALDTSEPVWVGG